MMIRKMLRCSPRRNTYRISDQYCPGMWEKILSVYGAAELFQVQVEQSRKEHPERDYIVFDLKCPHHWLHFTLPKNHIIVER